MTEPALPICSVFIAVSIDGYIARLDGSIDWLASVQQQGEDYGYAQFAASVDTLVLGRKTYDTALGFDAWPYAGKRCVVLTHASLTSRHGEEFFNGGARALVEQLARAGARRVYVDGGAVIRQFLAAQLIEDLTLSVIPILLGNGIPLFQGGAEQSFTLDEARSWPTGLAQLRYRARR